VPSERCSIEEQWMGVMCLVTWCVALGTLPEDGNVMPKHVGATIHNS
jgi:hypothetical protein